MASGSGPTPSSPGSDPSMNQQEADLISQIRAVGFNEAKRIFSFLEFWETGSSSSEEELPPPSGVSKKRMTQLTLIGEAVLSSYPKKPIGRKPGQINPNSVFQRVSRAVHEILAEEGPMMRSDILPLIAKRTGLSGSAVASASGGVKGIERHSGLWMLPKAA